MSVSPLKLPSASSATPSIVFTPSENNEPTSKSTTHRKRWTERVEQTISSFKRKVDRPLSLLQEACDFAQLIPLTAASGKKCAKVLSKVSGVTLISKLCLDLLKFVNPSKEKSKQPANPLKTVSALLSTLGTFMKSINWLVKINRLSLSKEASKCLKALSLYNKFACAYTQLIESMLGLNPPTKAFKSAVKFGVAALKINYHFTQSKLLKTCLKTISKAMSFVNDSLELRKTIQKIAKGKDPLYLSALKLTRAGSTWGLSTMSLGELIIGGTVQLPALVLILSALHLGSEAALYAIG